MGPGSARLQRAPLIGVAILFPIFHRSEGRNERDRVFSLACREALQFRGEVLLNLLSHHVPDVFNHLSGVGVV